MVTYKNNFIFHLLMLTMIALKQDKQRCCECTDKFSRHLKDYYFVKRQINEGEFGPRPQWTEEDEEFCGIQCEEIFKERNAIRIQYPYWNTDTTAYWKEDDRLQVMKPVHDIPTLAQYNQSDACLTCKSKMSRKSVAKFYQWYKSTGYTNPIMKMIYTMLTDYYGESPILSNQCSKNCDAQRHMQNKKILNRKTQKCMYCDLPSYASNAKICSKDKYSICNMKRLKEWKLRKKNLKVE